VNACVHAHTSLCISAFTHTFMHSHAIHLSWCTSWCKIIACGIV
jgi:hypothetical protein